MPNGFFLLFLCNKMEKMLTIIGPTASGKTTFATALAATMGAEIISADRCIVVWTSVRVKTLPTMR